MQKIVESNTQIDAKSPSLLNFTAIIAQLVALGMESKKKVVYLMVDGIGKYDTQNITTTGIKTSLITVEIYAHLSKNSCLTLIFASRIPITNIDSGVTILDIKLRLDTNFVNILYDSEPTSASSTSGLFKTKNIKSPTTTEIITGLSTVFLIDTSFLFPVIIYTPQVQFKIWKTTIMIAQ